MKNYMECNLIEELGEIAGDKLPIHVGLIPDGNRRWARSKKLDSKMGHLAGYEALKNILFSFFKAGIKYLSIYALSLENARKRSPEELKYIYKIIMKACEAVRNEPLVVKEKVRVNIIGRLHLLPPEVKEKVDDLMEFTKDHSQNFINILIMYDGQEEIVDGVKKLLQNNMNPENISRETIKEFIYTYDFPELDYIIRTGMDDGARISGFLLWDASYAEFKFRNEYWPDYTEDLLLEDLKDFVRRNRRKGK